RWRAFRYLMARMKNFGRAPGGEFAAATSREQRIYLIYGLLAWLYSYWLLGYFALRFGDYLTREYQLVGLALFLTLLGVFFRHPLKNMTAKITRRWTAQPLKVADPPTPVPPAPLKRRATLIACLAAALLILYMVPMELKVSSEFKILPLKNSEVRAEIEGIISEIYVDEGAVVNPGDPIARLVDRDLRTELQMNEATIAEKTAKLKMLRAGTRPEEIDLARRAVDTAKTRKESSI